MVKAVPESFHLTQGKDSNEPLEMVFCGIAYDFCVKNRVLDTANFVAPAIQLLKIMQKRGATIDEKTIERVVGTMQEIVADRIAQGEENIKDGISLQELAQKFHIGHIDSSDIHSIQIRIPRGTTIDIFSEVGARKEMSDTARKQRLGFSEPTIDDLAHSLKPAKDRIQPFPSFLPSPAAAVATRESSPEPLQQKQERGIDGQ